MMKSGRARSTFGTVVAAAVVLADAADASTARALGVHGARVADGLGMVGQADKITIGLIGLGVAWYQWYNSDKTALRAMRARVVAPHEAPELHAMIDRLCLQAGTETEISTRRSSGV